MRIWTEFGAENCKKLSVIYLHGLEFVHSIICFRVYGLCVGCLQNVLRLPIVVAEPFDILPKV